MSNLRATFHARDGVDHVTIRVVGDGSTIIRPVVEADRRRFARQWKSYKTVQRAGPSSSSGPSSSGPSSSGRGTSR